MTFEIKSHKSQTSKFLKVIWHSLFLLPASYITSIRILDYPFFFLSGYAPIAKSFTLVNSPSQKPKSPYLNIMKAGTVK